MKKKRIIIGGVIAGIILVIAASFFLFARYMSQNEEEEDMLVYDGGGSKEDVVDLAIQGEDSILYIRKIKLILDKPALGDVIDVVNTSGEGIDIQLNDKGEIIQIQGYPNNETGSWQIQIDNKNVDEKNVWNILVENYQGITFIWK